MKKAKEFIFPLASQIEHSNICVLHYRAKVEQDNYTTYATLIILVDKEVPLE